MEAVVFVGIQGAGKSSFYKEQFFDTHVRINLDMLRTRHRETLLLRACVEVKQPFVVDNTNPTVAERAKYIGAVRAAGFRVVGYYSQSVVADCIRRNEARDAGRRVPARAIGGTARWLELPALAEGFDRLHYVRIEAGRFLVEEWRGEV